VAGDAAAAAALAEVAGAFAEARAEGRLVQRLPLAAVEPGHLIRDRIAENEEEMDGLMASLAAHGQRSPIDVTEIAPGRFGLISGWRRLTALSRLHDRTGEARFATVLALVRRPETAAAAYVAMVEENEVRLALSYYERARIAARAVDAGVFPTEKAALQTLYASASRARRSKIGSFLTLYRRLDPVLRFPAAIGERLGLALAQMVDSRPAHLAALVTALTERPAPGFLDELVLLQEAVDASGLGDGLRRRSAPPPALPAILPGTGPAIHPGTPDVSRAKHPVPPAAAGPGRELRPGVFLQATGGGLRLSGPGVDAGFRAALEDWLAAR
jgi:ParB/RepB/Spo0J family partition protein